MRRLKTYGLGLLVVLFGVVVYQNASAVRLRFLVWEFFISQALLLPAVLLLGIIVGLVVAGLWSRKRHHPNA